MSLIRPSAFATALLAGAFAIAVGCGSFDGTDDANGNGDGGVGADGAGADGNVAATVAKRDLRVAVEWPANADLDPTNDTRLSKIKVTLTDRHDGARKKEVEATKDQRGPYAFPQFESTNEVDVVVELRGADDRLIGFGAGRGDVSATDTVTAVARRRLLYAIRGDGNAALDKREIVTIDLAPSEFAEPGVNVTGQLLAELPWANSLVMTSDARLLAVAHTNSNASTTGGVTVYETSTHQPKPLIGVPFVPGEMIPIGDGNEVLVAPGRFSNTTAMKRVNVVTGATSDAATGLQGGSLDVVSAVESFDRRKVLLVGNHRASPMANPKPYLLEYDETANTAAAPIEIPDIDRVTAARWSRGGEYLIVAGWQGPDEDHCSGRILTFMNGRGMTQTRAAFANSVSKVSNIVVHPSGQRLFVSSDMVYANSSTFSGDFYVLDNAWNLLRTFELKAQGPELGIASAVLLPYAPFRVFGGQTDPANNYHGSLVELPGDANDPVEILVNGYTSNSSIVSLATPFGQRL